MNENNSHTLRIGGSHSGAELELCLLRHNAVEPVEIRTKFLRSMSAPKRRLTFDELPGTAFQKTELSPNLMSLLQLRINKAPVIYRKQNRKPG
jgi:hypothetical protein